jgi:predicted metal-binding protein
MSQLLDILVSDVPLSAERSRSGWPMVSKQQLVHLTQAAKEMGATSSAIISSKEIQVKDHLAVLCNGEYTCPNYGLAASCPPHVEGAAEFRKWQARSRYSITVKIELPTSVMFSNERNDVMRLLHQIVAAVEQKAIEMGFEKSKAFAGGSCKELFCDHQANCCVVAENKPCRHMAVARPSMSGFGIDVTQLMLSSGWPASKAEKSNVSDKDATSWVAGLILMAS